MEFKSKNHRIYTMKFIIPILLILSLFFVGISNGVITFKKPEITTETITASIIINFGEGIIHTKTITLVNSTVYDFFNDNK